MEKDIFSAFDTGQITADGETTHLASLHWNRHGEYEGVYLKNIVTADKTGGLFTCHLVRIEPGKKIGLHSHPSSIELHEVIWGDGVCLTGQRDILYAPGSISILPADSPHEVRAGENGLHLFAKFINIPR